MRCDGGGLQCGHGPKAVENTQASVSRSRGGALQCGHGPKAVENIKAQGDNKCTVEASMRPRPEGRGEPQRRLQLMREAGSFNAATARRPWRTEGGTLPWRHEGLQCGHGPKAVENCATTR